jgi:hypothetical protein
MAWFNKYYRCPCGTEWQDEWDCLCDDRCPTCDTSCEPYDHAEIDLGSQDKAIQDAMVYGTGVVHQTETDSRSVPFIMILRKGTEDESTFLDLPDGCVDLRDLHNTG